MQPRQIPTGKCHDDHTDHVGLSRAIFALSPTVGQQTNDLTTLTGVIDTRLPIGGNVLGSICSSVPKVIDVCL